MRFGTHSLAILSTLVFLLCAACSKGGSTAGPAAEVASNPSATIPGTTVNLSASCTFDGVKYVDSNGSMCAAAGQTLCPASGVWVNQYGQSQACTPNQYINSYPILGSYPSNYTPNPAAASNCQAYTVQYGVPYVPFILDNEFVCLRFDLLQQQANYDLASFGEYFTYGYDFYFAYPPYSDPACTTQINLGGSWGSVAFCF